MPRSYFFLAGAFFFLTGFLATNTTLGILYMSVICIYDLLKPTLYLRKSIKVKKPTYPSSYRATWFESLFLEIVEKQD